MTPLEIQIKTVADLNGANLTVDAMQRVKEATQQAASKGNAYVEAHSKVTDEMKQQAQAALRNIDATKKLSDEAASLGKNVNTAKQAFGGLKDIISGALNGNLLQIGAGFGKISAAVTHAGAGMQALFGQIARGASAAAVVAAPLLILIQAMKLAASDAEAAMKRWWDEAAKSAEAYKQRSAEVKAAAEKDLADQLAAVQRLASAYDTLLSQMDKAEKRADAITAAQKEKALAEASTPEEKAAIEAKFGQLAQDTEVARANLRERHAEDAQSGARGEIDAAKAAVREAQQRFDASPSRANKEAVAAAESNLGQVQDRAGAVIQQGYDQIDQSRTTREIDKIRRSTKPAAPRSAETAPSSEAPRFTSKDEISAASFRGEISPTRAVEELKKLRSSAEEFGKAVGDNASATAKELDKAKKKLKLAQQAGPGGGG